ncbi:AaceriAFR607Cp [[Ashbya] aceris (nom. inval.)]|nr:AaceriAFR607Cp [[Ashbya] aceris (nom. inval.)]
MVDYANWMSEVDGNAYVSQLSLPGTHNSAACHMALPSVRCQDCSVSEQLEHGVRFLDVRLGKPLLGGKDRDGQLQELHVVHGKFPVRLPFPVKFDSTLEEVFRFLDEHPAECVVVSLKQEGADSWDHEHDEFANFVWDHYIAPHADRWYLHNGVPRLDDARGKVVLFRRFGLADDARRDSYGIEANWWSYNTTSEDRGAFQVQDFCEVNQSEDITLKAGYVKQLLDTAHTFNSTNPDTGKMFLNFCSASNFRNPDCWPERIAERMAECRIYDSVQKGAGVVVIDYAGMDDWRHTRAIVDSNF